MSNLRILAGLLCLAATFPTPRAGAVPAADPPAPFVDDVAAIARGVASTHPQPAFSVDPRGLDRALRESQAHPPGDATPDAAWRTLSRLNPLLADGHFFVGYRSWREETTRHLGAGGRLFPFEVAVGADRSVRIVAALGGASTPLAGRRVASINGVAADTIAAELLRHMHGDSLRFRSGLLSERWWFYYWKLYGAPVAFDIGLDGAPTDVVRTEASARVPSVLADEDSFDRQFRFELRRGNAAVMTINTFAWPEPERFRAFTAKAFEQMQAAGTRTLVIDIRRNGGGDDSMWLDGVLPYIADKPYRWASRYTKKVLRPDPAKGERVGEVRSGSIDTWAEPDPLQPHRFHGRTYVLVGRTTYSSAVLFANTMQDFGFGIVAGEGGSVRSRQSGGVQRIDLPNTGLALWVPRFILTRPSGRDAPYWLTPDLLLDDDPLDPDRMVAEVVKFAAAQERHEPDASPPRVRR